MSANSTTKELKPGYIKIHRAVVTNAKSERVDVSGLIVELNFYESIFSPFITGSLTLADANALDSMLPFFGNELLAFDIEGPSYDTDKRATRAGLFHIYKMGSKENATTKAKIYTLYFQSIEATVDLNRSISRTLRGKISTTVKTLAENPEFLDCTKPIIVEDTVNNEIHTSNFWSPVKNIYYLAERALNGSQNPSFTFFENNEGFVFASLDTLSSNDPVATFYRDQNNVNVTDSSYATILDMNNPVVFDYIDRVRTGYYGGMTYHYEVESKRLNKRTLRPIVDVKKVFLNNTNADVGYDSFKQEANVTHGFAHNSLYSVNPKLPIDHEMKRSYLLSSMSSQRTNIQVFGKLEYTAGQVVELIVYIDAPVYGETPQEFITDKFASGRYLITAINHSITKSGHISNIELCKDSIIS